MVNDEVEAIKLALRRVFDLRRSARIRARKADKVLLGALLAIVEGQDEQSLRVAQVFDAVAGMEPASRFLDPL